MCKYFTNLAARKFNFHMSQFPFVHSFDANKKQVYLRLFNNVFSFYYIK